ALSRAQSASETTETARAALVAGLPEALRDADLPALAGRLAERDTLGRALAEGLALFDETAEGEARADVAAELEGFDPEAARAELALLDSEGESRTGALKEAHGRAQQALADRRAAEAGEGAESAAFERLSAEAELVELGRQWFVTRLASLLLSGALEHHRARQGDPLLASAGQLFGSLTQGAFGGVLREFGEDDRPRLLARRATGETVGLDGLSEGTRDQLYLALRLAFLADYSARAETAPFIGDDLFQSFDDARTAAGLRTLAGQSEVIQPILFTHHASVVDIARRELGDRLDLLEF
ncbi:ATP-binding protein, partial [Stappia sp.]|uniref:ATP-binding protein n=1 Tax=Stappia sp. TaxID=1870903 RepID=UPI003A99B35F